MKNLEYLDVVDENDNVIGQELRNVIHKKGILHREVNVWVFNDRVEVLLQKRALVKDTFPGLWDASAGGHVDAGTTYDEAARKELAEETGIQGGELISVRKMRSCSQDKQRGVINDKFKMAYIYKFIGELSDLKIEQGQATELKFFSLDELLNLSEDERMNYTFLLSDEGVESFKTLAEIIKEQINI